MKFLQELKGLISGSDGNLSIRRILGVIAFGIGTWLLIIADKPIADSWIGLLFSYRGGVLILLSFFLFNMVTVQNIKDIVDKAKEKKE